MLHHEWVLRIENNEPMISLRVDCIDRPLIKHYRPKISEDGIYTLQFPSTFPSSLDRDEQTIQRARLLHYALTKIYRERDGLDQLIRTLEKT